MLHVYKVMCNNCMWCTWLPRGSRVTRRENRYRIWIFRVSHGINCARVTVESIDSNHVIVIENVDYPFEITCQKRKKGSVVLKYRQYLLC